VHLVATVMDRRRNFVTDLDQSDFKILEDGAPQDIRYFGRETDLPLRIGILLEEHLSCFKIHDVCAFCNERC